MSHFVLPALFALFVWWFSTGVIIYLDGLPQRTFRWSMLGATLLLVAALYGLARSSADASIHGAYLAFTWGLLAWGWQEISFYMGYVTGPRRAPCPEGCRGWAHFLHAIQTSLWHELVIIACAVVIVATTWHQPNQIGMWTFMVLWWMHQSAKLNVFLGVRNLNEQFLPEHLKFLSSFLRKEPMNLLFPLSVTVSTIIAVLMFARAFAAGTSAFDAAGYTFVGTMMALAILEHWFLVLPLPAARLWDWSLHSRGRQAPFDVEIVAGFLGAGKTTFVRNALAATAPDQKTVVLVNDFAAVGIDASLLRGRGADVVELPNGCICCSLRDDLATQLQEMIARWAPERVLIEPSGVADLASLVAVLNRPDLQRLVRSLRVVSIIDAAAFLPGYAERHDHFAAQARLAVTLVVNKTDLVAPATLATVQRTLRSLNPAAKIVNATFGVVTETDAAPVRVAPNDEHQHEPQRNHHQHEHHNHAHHDHEYHDHEAALGLTSWNSELPAECDPQALHELLSAIVAGRFGDIVRVKGIARAAGGWVSFDVAGGHPGMAAFAGGDDEQPRVIAIGSVFDAGCLDAAFAACAGDAVPLAA